MNPAQDIFEEHFAACMEQLGIDLSNPSLAQTPQRVANMFFNETCKGLFEPPPALHFFSNEEDYHEMVLVKHIEVKSLCEHHFQPFVGYCHIAYIPQDKILGLSKFARVVDHFSRQPQVQERLTQQIFTFLCAQLGTKDIAIFMDCEHYCMKLRGVETHSSTTATQQYGGVFQTDSNKKREFAAAIHSPSMNG